MPFRRSFHGPVALFAALVVMPVLRAQTSLPITLTGFTGDIILGAGESEPGGTTTVDNGYIYYGVGASDGGATLARGLPSNGEFTSQSNSNVEFQLAPYTGNNILQGGGTLTLSTPGSFQSLSFLATSYGSSSFSVTLNFSNSTSVTTSVFSVPDWTGTGGSGTVALSNIGLVQPNGTGAYNGNLNFEEYDFTVPALDQSLTLDSITINNSAPSNFQFFGASGESAVPEPATYTAIFGVVALGMAGQRELRRRRKLSS